MLAGVLALVQATVSPGVAPPLTPASKWTVEYNAGDCTLSRRFGDPANPFLFGFRGPPNFAGGNLVMVAPGATKSSRGGAGSVTLLPAGTRLPVRWGSAPMNATSHAIRLEVAQAFWDALPGTTAISLDVGEPKPVIAALGSMTAPLGAMKACGDDLLRQRSVDLTAIVGLSNAVGARIAREMIYPDDALHNREQGRAAALTSYDRAGQLIACRVVVSSGSKSLDGKTCEIFRAHGRVDPVPETGPETRYSYTPVVWALP